jgi:sigma-E factor negative regulatory protein RseB
MSVSSRRITGVAVLIGLLGAGLATLALVDVSAAPSLARRGSSGTGPGELPAAARPDVAGLAGAAGTGWTGRTGRTAASSRVGLRLLSEAAAAGVAISYQGVQIVAWLGPHGSSSSVVHVWHEHDRSILAEITDMGSASAETSAQTSAGEQDPDGILGLSRPLLDLMCANYQVTDAGRGSADGRPAQLVDLRRPDGSLAARFWLDAVTKLPLRREIFDARARMISEDAFISLQIGDSGLRGMPATDVRPWSARLDPAQVARLRTQGWPMPAKLPGNLILVAAHAATTPAGQVIDLDYSDGLSVVSIFLQRGQLPRAIPGWREVVLRGRAVYSADPDLRSLAWSAHGFVYTVIAAAPPATVDQVVSALPHDAGPGFWGRIARGLRRLASLANPFH